MQLAVGELERRVGVEGRTGLPGLALQRRGDALAAPDQPQVALVGEYDGFGPAASADDDWFGFGTSWRKRASIAGSAARVSRVARTS